MALKGVIDPVTFCTVLPLVLVPVTAYFLFRLGALIKDNVTATSLVLLYLPLVWGRTTGGLQRDFVLPLFVPFLYYLICQRYVIVLVLLTLQALFYPPALLVSLATNCNSNTTSFELSAKEDNISQA